MSRNVMISLVGGLVQVAVTIAFVPLYISAIGVARYGVLSLVWALLGYFTFTTLGTGPSLTHRIASARNMPQDVRDSIFWTGLWTSALLGMVGAVITVIAALISAHFVAFGDAELKREFLAAIPMMALLLPVSAVTGAVNGALQGRESFLSLTLVGTGGAVLGSLVPLIVVWTISPRLDWIMAGILATRILLFFITLIMCWRIMPLMSVRNLDKRDAGSMLQYGGWLTVSGIIGPLMTSFDRFAIGTTLGPTAVAHYSVPSDALQRLWLIPSSLTTVMFPRLSSLSSDEERYRVGLKALNWLIFIMTPVMLLGSVAFEPLLSLWLGKDFAAQAAVTGQILLVGIWINSLARVPHVMLMGSNRPRLAAIAHSVEILPYMALLFAGIWLFGLPGAAMAWTVRCIADSLLLGHFAGLQSRHARLCLVPGILVALTAFITSVLPADSAARWGACAAIILWSAAWLWSSRPSELSTWMASFVSRTRRITG